MHVPEGVLSPTVLVATNAAAAIAVGMGLRRLEADDMPKVAVLSSAFFVASSLHVPVGVSSAHLLLNGLVGIVLGSAAFPALGMAVLLQAVLLSHGGLTAWGANVLAFGIPAVGCRWLFVRPLRRLGPRRAALIGAATGAVGVSLGIGLVGLALWASRREFLPAVYALWLAHIPILLVEAFVTGSTLAFLSRVRPDLLGIRPAEEAS